MAKNYEILVHPADLKIRAFGKTKEELFLNMILAMSESLKPGIKKPLQQAKKEIKVESSDLGALLIDFLSEILYLIQTNKEIYNKIKFKKFTDTGIEAEIYGQEMEGFGEDIKAVTYHDLVVKKVNDHWEGVVLFDI